MSDKDMPASSGVEIEVDHDGFALIRKSKGLTKLEYFTAKVLQGLSGNSNPVILDLSCDEVASLAVRLAEAAFAELEMRNV